jgi:hypothetical protein
MVAYLKAEEEARDMWVNDIDLAAYHSWSDIPEFPQSVVRMTMEMNTPDGRVTANTKEHLKGIARQWRSIKVLTSEKSKDPDKFIDDWIDDRFYKLALKELKAQGLWTSEKLPGFPVKHRPGQDKRHNLKDFANVKLKPKEWMPTKAKWPA